MQITPVKCDCCGEMTDSFSDRSKWFGKYLKPEENRICLSCIKGRLGYKEEFKERVGMEVLDD